MNRLEESKKARVIANAIGEMLDKENPVTQMTVLTMIISQTLALMPREKMEETAAKLFYLALKGEPMYRRLLQDKENVDT